MSKVETGDYDYNAMVDNINEELRTKCTASEAMLKEMYLILKVAVNSDMAMREEDEGNVSPILESARLIINKYEEQNDTIT